MSLELRTVLEAVSIINDEIAETVGEDKLDEVPFFDVHTDSWDIAVDFLGERIWCSSNDERSFIDSINDYEPLDGFLRKQCYNFINNLSKIQNIFAV